MIMVVIDSDYVHYLSAFNMWFDWLFLEVVTF